MKRTLFLVAALHLVASLGCPAERRDPPVLPTVLELAPQIALEPRVRPDKPNDEDRKEALLRSYPDPLRESKSDETLARELDVRVWAFEYSGGPLRCWLELETTGLSTTAKRIPESGAWTCDAPDGRVVFSVGRYASERMQAIMKKAGQDADPRAAGFKFHSRSAQGGKSQTHSRGFPESILWFGWPPDGTTFAIAVSTIGAEKAGVEFTILKVDANEMAGTRKATLLLKGAFEIGKKD